MKKKWFIALGVTVLTLGIGTAAFADGMNGYSNRDMQDMRAYMEENGMNVEDMRAYMENNGMNIEDMRDYMRNNGMNAEDMRAFMQEMHPEQSEADIDRMYNHCHGSDSNGRGMMGYRSSMMR
ncbi:hypothetical protein [Paenibacillus sp. 1001270B_150601_E10]|uniref:hypothetical protein n=1 Tax=Paenibacillus sp. 1001270B_150601_E10 TaxID=2787079 RepID=UPI00189F179C|nr:hypothetical protein [Paenibacillus sp. 1001270B_150601_E10]